MQTQPNKRIVSKGEYVQAQILRKITRVFGIALIVLAVCCGLGEVLALCGLGYCFYASSHKIMSSVFADTGVFFACMLLCCICAPIAVHLMKYGQETMEYSANIDTGVLLSRANTADLPAPDSLVRASQEPVQAQKAVLLRATTQGQETLPEQLVRAVNGQE